MKVFVTGATGYIGSAVCEALSKAGHKVIGLARSEEAAQKLSQRGIEPHRGELKDKDSLRAAARKADGVIHAASPGDATNSEADNSLLDAMFTELKGTNKPFVYTSGIWVIGATGEKVADENFPLHPAAISAWRVGCEQRALGSARDGIRAAVIRPGIVYGRGGGIPASMIRSAKLRGEVQFAGDGENHWPVVHVQDVADLYVRAFEKAAAGSLFHAAEKDSVKVRELALAASEGAGVPGKVAPWPLEEARKTLGAFADALALDQRISSEKARKILGWNPRQAGILEDLRRGSYLARSKSEARA
ncbi:MAG TPA: SDR family oxidoreductase [Candidatus Limnocylindrales bacterium]|nr:SDR family oxidoreductase [Candidatus Limnocylindrales bacterium]